MDLRHCFKLREMREKSVSLFPWLPFPLNFSSFHSLSSSSSFPSLTLQPSLSKTTALTQSGPAFYPAPEPPLSPPPVSPSSPALLLSSLSPPPGPAAFGPALSAPPIPPATSPAPLPTAALALSNATAPAPPHPPLSLSSPSTAVVASISTTSASSTATTLRCKSWRKVESQETVRPLVVLRI